ncbi:ribonuclease HII [Silvimonas iriomotensis]|uniref:Ribonuclease HII n=1 Tax=Silvimonas iriomotensis TaxID=449662 RepID=A0ABQ2P5M8_9NEIS|nr:ribonuclease HII [Silvimonas iriomotensis]GGP18759.1 ribonuclease HII [Silvimonas iriomotensis]
MLVCGVDEAGRGPLAGSVYAAAVILPDDHGLIGLDDSKKLTEAARERLFPQIQERALAWSIAFATHAEIDQINILQATMLAMQRAVAGLQTAPHKALIDGNRAPRLACEVQTVVGGDALHACISAASILAKVARDREVSEYETRWPGYGFAKHKGYPTAAHLAALKTLGPCPVHRMSFGPVRQAVAQMPLWD